MDDGGIFFASLENWKCFPVLLISILLLIKNGMHIKNIICCIVHPKQQRMILKNFAFYKVVAKSILIALSIFMLFIALLRPQWGKKEQVIMQEGRDLLVVLDVSRSMLAKDMKSSRLEFVKLKIKALLSRLRFERVGLILFSGSAFIQCPLTIDYQTFLMFLDQVDVESIASGTTAIDTALREAVRVFHEIPHRKNKLVLLLTDGEDFSTDFNSVKSEAAKEGIHLLSYGVGTPEGAPIPIIDDEGRQSGHEVDEKGHLAVTKLDEKLLKNISNELGGRYFRGTRSDSDLDRITQYIESFEKEQLDNEKISIYEDRYPLFLGIAWCLLALEWIL